LCGETVEIAEKIKKIIRDHNGEIDIVRRDAIKKELGDVLWYIAAICTELDFHMEDVAFQNLEKLSSRKNRNKIHGYGDDR
jgi:NTP pyrophosphatase (non-canonical NTP hydrolase)